MRDVTSPESRKENIFEVDVRSRVENHPGINDIMGSVSTGENIIGVSPQLSYANASDQRSNEQDN